MAVNTESVGGDSTDGSTHSRIVQHQVLVRGLELHPNKSAHPVQKFPHKDKVSQAWLSALPSTHCPLLYPLR